MTTPGRPLSAALARAVSRRVAETRIGNRRGSVAALAREVTALGVPVSKSQLGRKLAGEYPLDTDEIDAIAIVLDVSPDDLWLDAIHLMTGDGHRPERLTRADWERIAERTLADLPTEEADDVRAVAERLRPAAHREDRETRESM